MPLPDASFDLALSEYGASIWADPYRWIPEAARLLRPGGRLVFLRNSTLVDPLPAAEAGAASSSQRPQRGLNRIDWPDDRDVEFHLAARRAGSRSCARTGFEVERLVELYAPDDAETHEYYDFVTAEWARKLAGRGDLGGAEAVSAHAVAPILLASTSPQRRVILEQLGIPFDVVAPDYEEHDPPDADPVELVREHARGKARSVARGRGRAARARRRHLRRGSTARSTASRRTRPTPSGCSSSCRGRRTPSSPASACSRPAGRSSSTRRRSVTFRELTPRELAHHLAHGEWEGRAGGYAIQGRGAALVERIEGDYLNVVGLPAALLVRLLAERFPGAYGLG